MNTPTPPPDQAAIILKPPAPGDVSHQIAALAQVLADIATRRSANRVQSTPSK